jgi:glycosyltransferase involved in cell wall biosynthesis
VYSNKKSGLGKKAIVVSPQSWGKMFISKHHYAVELSKLGYEVFFVNPPKENKLGGLPSIKIEATEYENLVTVNHTLFFSNYLKFHLPYLHHILIFIQRWLLLKKIGKPDIILSFDLTNNFPLKGLACKKIFFAADEPRAEQNFVSARNADLLVSVSQHILDLYQKHFPETKKLLINHGLSEEFLNIPKDLPKKYNGINIGLSGNFLFNDIDYPILLQIVEENPKVKFHFFGNHSTESNIGADFSKVNLDYLEQIKHSTNCIFHGVLSKRELALELNQMDAFLICYGPQKGQSSGSNSHKILEFLSTGKVIFSSHFSYYDRTDLFVMNNSRVDNSLLIKLFHDGIYSLNEINNSYRQDCRKSFSQENSYDQNLVKIIS